MKGCENRARNFAFKVNLNLKSVQDFRLCDHDEVELNWQLLEEKIEGMRKRLFEKIRKEHLSDEKMAMVMSKKWSKEDSFAANFQRQLAKQRGHNEHEVSSAWICDECDSDYRYPSGLLLQRHYEVEHPEIETLPYDPSWNYNT